MTVLGIRVFGDPVLTTKANEVDTFDDHLKKLVNDMTETMDAYEGAGLAANQVGVLRRVFVYGCGGKRGHIINPVWEPIGEETQTGPEGCLSVPGLSAETTRYAQVRATGFDYDGNAIEIEADGILARCIQHETDHLDGIMYMKRLDSDTRKAVMAQIRQAEWFTDPSWTYPAPKEQ